MSADMTGPDESYCPDCGVEFENPGSEACPLCGRVPARSGADAEGRGGGAAGTPGEAAAGGDAEPAAGVQARAAASALAPAGFWIRVLASLLDTAVVLTTEYILLHLSPAEAGSSLPAIVVHGIYYVAMTANWGQTLGKRVVGVRVVMMDGSRVGWPEAFVRWLGYWLNWLSLGLGYAWVGFGRDKRGWHDYLARTRVVRC